jgi:Plasmid pRiA4b ORF-3-like protein
MPKTVEPKRSDDKSIVSLKVTLRGTRPPVWRRLLMPGTMTLADLHQAIQAAMGWEDCHLHVFDIAGRRYGGRHAGDDVADEKRPTLNSLVKSGVARFTYTYDFGDDWEHTVVIEKRPPPLGPTSYPTCVAGKRNCPPEDCGGPWGYERLLAALADPASSEHAEQIEWLGEEFDPDDFSVDIANATLNARFHRK